MDALLNSAAMNFDGFRRGFYRLLFPSSGAGSSLGHRIRGLVWGALYQALSRFGTDDVLCMNYGYLPESGKISIELDEEESKEASGVSSFQLYHETASAVEIAGKDVLEVGSGRGGGAGYIVKHLSPKSVIGVELASQAVALCNRLAEGNDKLTFVQGDAMALPLEEESCDVVVNVESSHCYPSFAGFVQQVHRVLRPGGKFVISDFRFAEDVPQLESDLEAGGFVILEKEDISRAVLRSLDANDAIRRERIRSRPLINFLLGTSLRSFAGAKGTAQYKNFLSGEFIYMRYAVQKM